MKYMRRLSIAGGVCVFTVVSIACCCPLPPPPPVARPTPPVQIVKKTEQKAPPVVAKKPAVAPKISRENYNRVRMGMSANEVEAILGPGQEIASGSQFLILNWQDWGKSITITFGTGPGGGLIESKSMIGD